ncbi:MAG: anthranilate phosphoribosyltransferase [Mycetocola sp.]
MIETPTWSSLLLALLNREDLSVSEATWAMEQVMLGNVSDARLAAFLVALSAKGETVDEVVGFRDAALDHARELPVSPWGVDIVGTGGDRFGTVNVSTMASIVVAATGVPVIKHGNRAASSLSGSSDVLGALGIPADLEPERVAEILQEVGITFANAAAFHPGFRHAAAVRSELGVPTVFNFLGPLCNPARPEASAIGVAKLSVIPLMVGVFQTRGATALVFRGDDGLDELTTTGHSHIWEVNRGSVTEHDLNPRDLGIPIAQMSDLIGGSPEHNAAVVRETLSGKKGPVRDIVILNAAAGIIAYELSRNAQRGQEPMRERFVDAMARAAESIDSGAAQAKLDSWVSSIRN